MKLTLGCIRRADEDYKMIDNGDKIAVGLSGGKDSVLLLYAFHLYRFFCKKKFDIHALMVDLGFENFNADPFAGLCEELSFPFTVIKTNISKIVFETRKEQNPCALCSKLRKGAFYKRALELGLNKAAYAHNGEDVIGTFFLSLLFEGRINTLSPVTYLSRSNITLIRPFIYLSEKHIKSVVKKLGLPVMENMCPASGNTKRAEIKELIKELSKKYPKANDRILSALRNKEKYTLWDKAIKEEIE